MGTKITSYIKYISICFLAFLVNTAISQSKVPNPSFEDEPADATSPFGWYPCAPYTTPDIFPGYWGVYNDATDGDTFVGLITRDDGSYESITARVDSTLEKDVCYQFGLDLAHSKTYSGFNKPISIKIYIGSEKCQKDQLIFQSPVIEHKEWDEYYFQFTPKNDAHYLILEAFYKEEPTAHKGNILIDNLTTILACNRA